MQIERIHGVTPEGHYEHDIEGVTFIIPGWFTSTSVARSLERIQKTIESTGIEAYLKRRKFPRTLAGTPYETMGGASRIVILPMLMGVDLVHMGIESGKFQVNIQEDLIWITSRRTTSYITQITDLPAQVAAAFAELEALDRQRAEEFALNFRWSDLARRLLGHISPEDRSRLDDGIASYTQAQQDGGITMKRTFAFTAKLPEGGSARFKIGHSSQVNATVDLGQLTISVDSIHLPNGLPDAVLPALAGRDVDTVVVHPLVTGRTILRARAAGTGVVLDLARAA